MGGPDGMVLIDSLVNLDEYSDAIDRIRASTGLPILEPKNMGLGGFENPSLEARTKPDHSQS